MKPRYGNRFDYLDDYTHTWKTIWVEKENDKCYKVYKVDKGSNPLQCGRLVHVSRIPCCLEWMPGACRPIINLIHFGDNLVDIPDAVVDDGLDGLGGPEDLDGL